MRQEKEHHPPNWVSVMVVVVVEQEAPHPRHHHRHREFLFEPKKKNERPIVVS